MKITSKDIEDSKQNRDKFNKYYNDAVIDVITLKNYCNMSMKEIQDATPYKIDFVNFVFENYDINKTQHARCVRGHAGQDTVRRRSSFIQTPPVYTSWDDN